MTCKSGCCGPPVGAVPEQSLQEPSPFPDHSDECSDKDSVNASDTCKDACCSNEELKLPTTAKSTGCQDACCAGPSESADVDDCCESNTNTEDDRCNPAQTFSAGCNDGCCSELTKEPDGEVGCESGDVTVDDDCCTPKSSELECKERDRSVSKPSRSEDLVRPSCCTGKESPCCDVSCLERIALRECKDQKEAITNYEVSETPSGSCASSTCHRGRDGKPCSRHSRTAREKYAATLEALGCICRALLALGQQSCCAPRPGAPAEKKRRPKKSCQSVSRTSLDSCCAVEVDKDLFTTNMRSQSRKGCCRASSRAQRTACPNIRQRKSESPEITDLCLDACCTEQPPSGFIEKSKEVTSDVDYGHDLEKRLSGEEHILLSVSGMTCTGCETKLKRTLGTIASVKNLKTSLVLARAEFDLDLGAGSLEEVMKHLERTTEFKCERIMDQGSSIDLIASDPLAFVQQSWPYGVTSMTAVDKRTVRVTFDAQVIGARELVEKGWQSPVNLAPLRADPTIEAGGKHVRHTGYMTLLSIVLTIPVLVLAWAPLPKKEIAYGSVSLALATVVQCVIAGPFYPKALKSLVFSRMIEMDLLIVLSTSAAFIFSVVSFGYLAAGQPLSTGEFFETSTLLVTLIMVGRFVSVLARQKAVESISVRSLQASTVTILGEGNEETEIDVRLLQYGDVFKVSPDSRIPTDGTVVSGSSEVNESMLTGEARPIEKYSKSPVIAGSINGSGTLIVRLTRLPGDNTISTIAGMVDEAKLSKPKIQDIADRVASYFVPTVIVLTLVTFVVWIAVGTAVRKQSGAEATTQAITYAITVLIVSCPCAIGLAVPMVVVIASGVAAENGVIFKSADSIELAHKTTHVVFDKTGTLTEGKLTVVHEQILDTDPSSSMSLLLGLVDSIKHPVSMAVAAHLKAKGTLSSAVSDPKSLTGKGVEGFASGMVLRAGNSRWLGLSSDPRVQSVLSQGYTAFCFTVNDTLAAVFGLEDSLRPDALATVEKLHKRGITVHITSGDDDGAVHSVATQLGIPSTNVRSRCSPADKQTYIQDLLTPTQRQQPVVVFCGDGTNDAVALAQATIGMHVNQGTDVAQSAADVVLLRSIDGVLTAIAVSEKSVRRIKFNFAWSFVYNLFAILLGAGAFVHARIPPQYAGLGELVSVLPVIAAAVHLRWSRGLAA